MLNRLQAVFASLKKHDVKYAIIDWVRIDVQTSTPGLAFEKAWRDRVSMEYQGQTFYVVSREDLVASKRAAGRDVDLEDVRLLELGDEEEEP